MCHGHPRCHPCAHTSINWYYCPTAVIDLETGYETPCGNVSFAPAQATKTDCPLQHCDFKKKAGPWMCCACEQGPNAQGWCTMPRVRQRRDRHGRVVEEEWTTCDHGCCKRCTRFGSSQPAMMPQMTFSELQRGTASKKFGHGHPSKSHRRGTGLPSPILAPNARMDYYDPITASASYVATATTITPPPSLPSSSLSTTPSSSTSGDSTAAYSRYETEHRSKRTKSSSKGHHKHHKVRAR